MNLTRRCPKCGLTPADFKVTPRHRMSREARAAMSDLMRYAMNQMIARGKCPHCTAIKSLLCAPGTVVENYRE